MARPNAIFAAGMTCLGFLCFAIASTAVGVPVWGHFENPAGGWDMERGYFGPWRVCKVLNYFREKCGTDVTRFKPSMSIYVSGILASISAAALGFFCILSVLQIAMISSFEKFILKYTILLVMKVILALLSCMLAIAAAVMFAYQIDDSSRIGFTVVRGISFYLQIVVIILNIGLLALALYDILFSKRKGRDPTLAVDAFSGATFNNPGFRERGTKNGISVTDASGKPYSNISTGSIVSINTTLTSLSNGSTIDSIKKSPTRSSLKKPKIHVNAIGIQNPGFSNSCYSPTTTRQGSIKKVRIQTLSTEV